MAYQRQPWLLHCQIHNACGELTLLLYTMFGLIPQNTVASEGIHGLTSHLGQLHLSTSTAAGAGASTQQHAQQQQQQYHLSAASATTPTAAAVGTATHTAQYTTQPAGWTISPTAHYIQQVADTIMPCHTACWQLFHPSRCGLKHCNNFSICMCNSKLPQIWRDMYS